MKIRFIVMFLVTMFAFTTATAAKVDIYRDAMLNKTFTLKYRINNFPIREISKEATLDLRLFRRTISDREYFGVDEVGSGGIIVFNGDDRYIENFHDAYTTTRTTFNDKTQRVNVKSGGFATLLKDDIMYGLFIDIKDGVKSYYSKNMWGGRSRKVQGVASEKVEKWSSKYENPYEKLFGEYNYGSPVLSQALVAIIPPDKVIAMSNTPIYKFVGSGNLPGGLSYEDFFGEKNDTFHAVRYYFDGSQLVKIATFSYVKNAGAVKSYEKHVVDIEEFSTTPDESYLRLPEGLEARK